MGFNYSPKIVNDNLMLYIDPANSKSYPGSGSLCTDLSRSKIFNMSLVNGASYSNSNNGVFTFDGIDDFVQSDVTMNGRLGQEMSFDVWFRRTQDMNLFNMVYSSGQIPYLAFRGVGSIGVVNKFLFSYFTRISGTNTQRTLYSTNTYSDNIWYNVVCTLSQNITTQVSESKIYINGVLDTTLTLSSSVDEVLQPTASSFRLGNYTSASYPFKGNIGPFKIYTKLLSADEVQQNYNGLKSRYV